MTPLLTGEYLNLHHNLVHAVQGGDVDFTMVGGRICVEKSRLVNADLDSLIGRVNELVPSLFARRADWLRRKGPPVKRGSEKIHV
jgi:5-methylthioadenosine/S-adenosylhomocysteine deaminase